MHPDTRLLKFNRVMDNQATRSESGDLSCVCSTPCTWGVVGRPPFRLFHPKLAEHFDAARLSMLSSMCQHVATSSNIAVVQMCRERQSLFQTASLFSTKVLYAVCLGRPSDISVFRWLRKQRPRFAQDQPMIEQPKLVLV